MTAEAETRPSGTHWHAIHTRSRHEKVVDGLLAEREIERFLPLVRVMSQWKDRKKRVEKPLFPGYLFVHVRRAEILTVWTTRGVVRLLGPDPSSPSVVPSEEVANLRRLVASEALLDPYPYLKPGQLVSIQRGPLRGVQGTLVRKARRDLLVISVPLLGRSVAVEVSAEAVQGL